MVLHHHLLLFDSVQGYLTHFDHLQESNRLCVFQIAAMQAGLLKVVPQAVLDLLTWQEVEKKVCGDPEITVEALKRLSECPALHVSHTLLFEGVTLLIFSHIRLDRL